MSDGLRWFVVFYYVAGGHEVEAFPEVDFWQPDQQTAISEGRRVLDELREREYEGWRAVGHPDPFAVARGEAGIYQWNMDVDGGFWWTNGKEPAVV